MSQPQQNQFDVKPGQVVLTDSIHSSIPSAYGPDPADSRYSYNGNGAFTPVGHDPVESPSHYTAGGIEAIEYFKAKSTPEEFKGYLRLNAMKYLSRFGLKNDSLEDMRKARWYIDKLIEAMS